MDKKTNDKLNECEETKETRDCSSDIFDLTSKMSEDYSSYITKEKLGALIEDMDKMSKEIDELIVNIEDIID